MSMRKFFAGKIKDLPSLTPLQRMRWFVIWGWLCGGILPSVALVIAVFVEALLSPSLTAEQFREVLWLLVLPTIYLAISIIVAFAIIVLVNEETNGDQEKIPATARYALLGSGVATGLYLVKMIQLTGGIETSIFAYTLLYLPATISWYLGRNDYKISFAISISSA